MRRILLLAAAALVASLGAADRAHAADPAPLTLGPAELYSIGIRRVPALIAPASAEQVPSAPGRAPTVLVLEPVSPADAAATEPASPVVTVADPATTVPPDVILAPAELQAIGPRPQPAMPTGEVTLLPPVSSNDDRAHPRPSRRPEPVAVAMEPAAAASPIVIVLAPAELQAVGPRATPDLRAAPSPQPRPTRLVLAPARMAPPVLAPAEPAAVIDMLEPSAALPEIRADDGPATLDDLHLQTIGIRIGAAARP